MGAFIWLNRLFLSGYSKVLKVGDLYPLEAMCAETLDNEQILRDTIGSKAVVSPSYAIEILDGSFAWNSDRYVLTSINLKIPTAGLTIIIGPVASGKSTLCKALLGETPMARGTTQTSFAPDSTRVGYCDQAPYLSNATIRENIVGFSRFDKDRYDEAVEAAVLRHDLDVLLPQGDQNPNRH